MSKAAQVVPGAADLAELIHNMQTEAILKLHPQASVIKFDDLPEDKRRAYIEVAGELAVFMQRKIADGIARKLEDTYGRMFFTQEIRRRWVDSPRGNDRQAGQILALTWAD